jgi:uncharacterized protein (TIGR02246 family)
MPRPDHQPKDINMKSLLLIASLLAASTASTAYAAAETPVTYHAAAPAPATAAEKEIAALFDRWNAALATGNSSEVVKLYAHDGILQPTVSNKIRATPEEIKDYFDHFLALKPHGIINYRQIRILDDHSAFDSGAYTFDIVKNDKPAKVRARYTYIYKKIDGDWKIVNHHSSAMPEFTRDE